jgi:hypothetical protein
MDCSFTDIPEDPDHIRPAVGEFLEERPQKITNWRTATINVEDAHLQEYRWHYATAVEQWDSELSRVREVHTERMRGLLARHRRDLDALQRDAGLRALAVGPVVEAAADPRAPDVFHIQGIAADSRAEEAELRRRQMIRTHKAEILRLNEEFTRAIRDLEVRRDANLEPKRRLAQLDIEETERPSQPPRPGTTVRFVVRRSA